MSDGDRDDLAALIHKGEHGPHDCPYPPGDTQRATADAILAAGWRRSTVTREQLLAVVQILDDVPAVRFPETWMRKARAIAHVFGLSVAEMPDEGLS